MRRTNRSKVVSLIVFVSIRAAALAILIIGLVLVWLDPGLYDDSLDTPNDR